MDKIKYDFATMGMMNLFEKITHAKLKDCFIDDAGVAIFIVQEHEFGKAVGKNGIKSKKVEQSLNRKIKIVEFNPNVTRFIENCIFPLKAKNCTQNEKEVVIEAKDTKTRGYLIGRAASNLRALEKTVKRYFDVEKITIPPIGA